MSRNEVHYVQEARWNVAALSELGLVNGRYVGRSRAAIGGLGGSSPVALWATPPKTCLLFLAHCIFFALSFRAGHLIPLHAL